MTITVLIADDEPLVITGITAILTADDHLDALGFADGEHQFGAEPQQSILVRHDKAPHLAFDDLVQQSPESLLLVVHARTEVCDHLECPPLRGAVQLKHLLLALQIGFLVMA